MKKIQTTITFLFFLISIQGFAQSLSVEQIMQDPKWMGNFPSNVSWDEKGESIYFNYNPEANPVDSLYKIRLDNPSKIEKVSPEEKRLLVPTNAGVNRAKTQKVFTRAGNLILYDISSGERTILLEFVENISNAKFLYEENRIVFQASNNLFVYDKASGKLKKITNIKSGSKPEEKEKVSQEREAWLKEDNLNLLQVVREREEKREASKAFREATAEPEAFSFYLGSKQITNLQMAPNGSYATFNLNGREQSKRTGVPDYTHVSGYTTNLAARSKVGDTPAKIELAVYDFDKDTVYLVKTDQLPGIKDLPDYIKDYPDKDWETGERKVFPSAVNYSKDGKYAVVNIRSVDNKDRWIALLDLKSGTLASLDRQRDEAWIAGPGIGWSMGGGTLGWLPDNKHIYFQSEESGYSHLFILDVTTGKKKQLTNGNFEVFDPKISNNGKFWYLSASEVDPGERHYYMMPIMGGKMERLTSLTGNNDVSLSPNEKHIAILYSYSNKPWELYLQENLPNATAKQLTEGRSEDFKAYDWRDPKLVKFRAEDGAMVPARLYLPEGGKNNGAAVIFVHGAGYLQNVHKWWSSYFREYMFHNLLTDLGYTVLDIDYRGSAGYGRDWRTGIYRHMGGKDLSDQVNGAKFLVSQHGVDPGKIGIYGGSYGGFITLMALFNASDTFKSGAALRSVTDWAHYNHGYTSNILNEPFNDPIAYKRSSPIYFAEGLKGHLLIAHGMLDVNVHFQDVVRLAQILIELEKDNWEMAVYPVEDHGFVEPSSWTDEYKRILNLFNNTLID